MLYWPPLNTSTFCFLCECYIGESCDTRQYVLCWIRKKSRLSFSFQKFQSCHTLLRNVHATECDEKSQGRSVTKFCCQKHPKFKLKTLPCGYQRSLTNPGSPGVVVPNVFIQILMSVGYTEWHKMFYNTSSSIVFSMQMRRRNETLYSKVVIEATLLRKTFTYNTKHSQIFVEKRDCRCGG